MAQKLLDGVTANTTSDPIDTTSQQDAVHLCTFMVAGELDGAIVRVGLSPDATDGSYQILTSSTVEASTGPLNMEITGGYYAALILTGASTSTSVDGYAGVATYGSF